jgi:hypothetical protein
MTRREARADPCGCGHQAKQDEVDRQPRTHLRREENCHACLFRFMLPGGPTRWRARALASSGLAGLAGARARLGCRANACGSLCIMFLKSYF